MSFQNRTVVIIAYIVSNVGSFVLLTAAWQKPKLARWLYLALFGWAGYINLSTAFSASEDYVHYANFTFIPAYKSFILGFSVAGILQL